MRGVLHELASSAPYAFLAVCLLVALLMVTWVVSLGIVLRGTMPSERPAIMREQAKLMRFWRRRG